MIEKMIAILEAKGHTDARGIVNELVEGGALTGYDAAKYCARHEVITIVSCSVDSTRGVIDEVAYTHCISSKTLRGCLGLR
jgi:hypothetical protein